MIKTCPCGNEIKQTKGVKMYCSSKCQPSYIPKYTKKKDRQTIYDYIVEKYVAKNSKMI